MGVMQGQVPADKVPAPVLDAGRSALAGAFGDTFLVAAILIILCVVPALFLPRRKLTQASDSRPLLPSH
jgi:hypothetical protein